MPMVGTGSLTKGVYKPVIKTVMACGVTAMLLLGGCASLAPGSAVKSMVYPDPLGNYRLFLERLPLPRPYDIKYRCDIYGSYSRFNVNGSPQLRVDAVNILGRENDVYRNNASALFDHVLDNYINLNHGGGRVTYRINMINRFGNALFAQVAEGPVQAPRNTGYLITRNNDIVYMLQTPIRAADPATIKAYLSQVLASMRIPNAPVAAQAKPSSPEPVNFINPSTASAQNVKDWLNKYGCS